MSGVFIQQSERFLTIETPFGRDVLKLTAFEGEEALSRLFTYRLEMLSEEEDLDPAAILGKSVTFSCLRGDGTRRYWNGICKHFSAAGWMQQRLRVYTAEIVPALWFLTRNSDCRIFQRKNFLKIIEDIFLDRSLTEYVLNGVRGEHPEREYCVQYRETDFNFVSRLMEEEGVYYFHRHEPGRHELVLGDNKVGYDECVEQNVEFLYGDTDWDDIFAWSRGFDYTTGRYAQRDYNYEESRTDLSTRATSLVSLSGNAEYEFFDYPGRYAQKGRGEEFTKVHMEAEEAEHEIVQGSSRCRTFTPGAIFGLSNLEPERGKQYVITWIRHSGSDYTHVAGEAAAEPPRYSNSFICVPSTIDYRPPRVTPKAMVHGPQTAVVVGPSGSEIHSDQYCRVKVQFHWDRHGRKNETSSCWVRVAQPWAGQNWGAVFVPRIGHEVVVSFLEGDPDRPLITGSVYNDVNREPYSLPANQTQSGILTRSSQGGSSENFNELRFEDKTGEEEIYFHAEKDFNRHVENDDTLFVGNDQTITIHNNRTETVEEGNETVTVSQGNRAITVSQGNDSLDVSAGNQSTYAAQNISIEAGVQIELKVGTNTITLSQSGIEIRGGMITIQSQGTMTVRAGAIMTINGSMVKIN